MALNRYLQQVQRLVGDANQIQMNPQDLIYCINEGRKQIAEQGQCLRYTPPSLFTVAGQEKYNFTDADISGFPGTSAILSIRTVAIIWGNFRYVLDYVSWSKYQARVRNYATGWQDVPGVYSQFGQGVAGTLYLYPLPSDAYPMEWDCQLLPTDLVSDSDIEAIPDPWTTAVPYYAAYLALTIKAAEQQNPAQFQATIALSDRHLKLYNSYLTRARASSQPGKVSSWYGRRF